MVSFYVYVCALFIYMIPINILWDSLEGLVLLNLIGRYVTPASE